MKDNHKGIVLVMSLAVIVILAVVVLEFNYLTRVDLAIAYNSRDSMQSRYLAKSAVNFAINLLRNDDDFSFDSLDEDWSQDLPFSSVFGGKVSLETVDEERKININELSLAQTTKRRKQLERLFRLLSKDVTVLQNIFKEAPFETIRQAIQDQDLLKVLTVATDGKVNINTASADVIEALSPLMNHNLARAIIDFRKDAPFKAITQLSPAYGYDKPLGITQDIYDDIKNFITVRSHLFSIKAEAVINQARYNIDAIVRRDGKICKILYWKEG